MCGGVISVTDCVDTTSGAFDHEMYVLHTCNTYAGFESHRSDIIALCSATDYRGVVGSSASAMVCAENRARV